MDERVSFRAAYERFPTSIKGAFVLRGGDGMPHQLRLVEARAADCGGRGSVAIPIEPAIIEVAPTMDTFIPFELSTMEMGAGWYQLECDVVVDGDVGTVRPGDRFVIAWPRAAVRRGTVRVEVSGIVAVECAGDSIRISYEAEKAPSVKLSVDGASHPVLGVEHDGDAAAGRIVGYPVLRQHRRLVIEPRDADPIEVDLP
jgi:hypothetical protein